MWMNRKKFSDIRWSDPEKGRQSVWWLPAFWAVWLLRPAWAQDDPVSMDVSYGYEDSAKGGRYLPVNVTIQNNQETPVEGTLEIKTRESDETVYRYDYGVEVEAKGSETTRYYIPAWHGGR